ncbi:4-hydroxybenzoate polyprenyl transferase [Ectothiorhodospira sp. PHS-1]|uniref:4-hydroxybenzoate octaprenyltransferase n=1 Tax=Ectothiorhodospira sp. PHS-1 TaxID=519989 RepID=UPI00024A89C6|nr:4-hydroxybenzoate polyprenyl transferase [Ectothiorhodospira sp. PHS-1]
MKPVTPDTAPLSLHDRLVQYALLTRLHRPIGILLLLWPTLWALWIAAEGMPDLLVLFVFVAGVALMRSAGCAINDFADRDIDGHVSRTRDRPLANRRISAREAVGVTVALALTAFALVLLMNPLTIALSVVALVLAVSYPFMKRFHHLPQVHLGAAFGWAVPMAFAAQTGEFPPPLAWLLFVATILWTTAYDTMYAMVDRPDDLKIGVKSSAILFGEADRLIIGILQGLTLVALALVGMQAGLGGFFYLGLGIAALLALYQQYLIHDRNPKGCFQAFLNNNWFGLAVFAGIIASYLFSAG